jgi:uncharacterized membrane protein HdeD (DUF308 family)
MTMTDLHPTPVLIDAIARNWALILMRGLAAIAFGIVCFVLPVISLLALVLLWGVYSLVDGVSAIIWGVRARWGSMVAVGVVSVLAGLIALVWPGITALALLYLIAAWAIVRGATEIAAAIRLRRRIKNEWLLVIGGIASIAFGTLVVAFPGTGALSVLWLIGSFAVIFGALAVGLSLRLRAMQRRMPLQHEETPVGAATASRTWDKDIR